MIDCHTSILTNIKEMVIVSYDIYVIPFAAGQLIEINFSVNKFHCAFFAIILALELHVCLFSVRHVLALA